MTKDTRRSRRRAARAKVLPFKAVLCVAAVLLVVEAAVLWMLSANWMEAQQDAVRLAGVVVLTFSLVIYVLYVMRTQRRGSVFYRPRWHDYKPAVIAVALAALLSLVSSAPDYAWIDSAIIAAGALISLLFVPETGPPPPDYSEPESDQKDLSPSPALRTGAQGE